MEIITSEEYNPIMQDTNGNGSLREYGMDSIVNYGCCPQTWEDPHHIDVYTKCPGDNDPIDVCDISRTSMAIGAVYPVKILGILGMIDEDETDWKVIGININDPIACQVSSVEDLRNVSGMNDRVQEMYEWFRDYKIPEGKGTNEFAFNGQAKNADFAMKIIVETHNSWKKLLIEPRSSKLWLPKNR